ncbi:alpha/beta hydrolase fold domain-containing protein [Chitinophaga flava]|nr:alpha/beta hydrolase fold domain-containing protein [Chitinophaga flava]
MDTSLVPQIQETRKFFDQLGNIYPPNETVTITNELIDNVPCYWFTPPTIDSRDIILFLHGGSYALGSFQSHKAMITHFAASLKRKILFVEYALAPEHPFPQGRNDATSVYTAIAAAHPDVNLFLIGDSAGGGILLSSLYDIYNNHVKTPAGIVLISAWLDLSCENESYHTRKDPILTQEEMKKYAGYYGQDRIREADPSQLIFKQLPPVLIMVGTQEVLFDDSFSFYEKASKIQPQTNLMVFENQTHVWMLTDIHSVAAINALENIKIFVEK